MISLVCAFSTHAAIVKVLERGCTRSIPRDPDEGEDFSVAALAYDSKIINLFALIGTCDTFTVSLCFFTVSRQPHNHSQH